jgi:hypothetical protein
MVGSTFTCSVNSIVKLAEQVRANYVERRPVAAAHGLMKIRRQPFIVIIQEREQFTCGQIRAGVPRPARSFGPRICDYEHGLQTRLFGCVTGEVSACSITVVDYDHFDWRKLLSGDGAKGSPQQDGPITRRHHCSYAWHIDDQPNDNLSVDCALPRRRDQAYACP